MERGRHPKRLSALVCGLFLALSGLACVSAIGEEVGTPPRYRGEDGGADAGGSAGAGGAAGAKGGNTGASGKAGAAGKGGKAGSGGSSGAAGEPAGGASGTEAAGGTEAGGAEAAGSGGAEAGGAGGTDAGGAGGSETAGTGGSTAGTGGTAAGMAGAGGSVVDEGPCPRVRVKNADPYANIRPDPSTGGTPIGKAYNGDIITCQGQVAGQNIEGDTNWYKLSWGSGTGYISGTLASCTKDK